MELANCLKEKKEREQKFVIQETALAILNTKSLAFQAAANYACLNVAELSSLLRYHLGTVPKGSKSALLDQWKAICIAGTKPGTIVPWSDNDEVNLQRLQKKEIAMADTNLGWQEAIARKELVITSANTTDEEWCKLCSKREEKINEMHWE